LAKHDRVSISVVRRLPRYFRFLGDLIKSGFSRISSKELSQRMGLTASQIRQDLNCFGGFGQQGYGYNVEMLEAEIGNILGTGMVYPAVIIGAGNIGRAIAINMDFENMGFKLIGIFDTSPDVVGTFIRDIMVLNISNLEVFCTINKPKIAVITVPREATPVIAEQLIRLGVTGFWNFTHYDFSNKYKDIAIENVHLGDSLMTLCYKIKNMPEKPTIDEMLVK
jgi:redox-sensing transcriptional repressor